MAEDQNPDINKLPHFDIRTMQKDLAQQNGDSPSPAPTPLPSISPRIFPTSTVINKSRTIEEKITTVQVEQEKILEKLAELDQREEDLRKQINALELKKETGTYFKNSSVHKGFIWYTARIGIAMSTLFIMGLLFWFLWIEPLMPIKDVSFEPVEEKIEPEPEYKKVTVGYPHVSVDSTQRIQATTLEELTPLILNFKDADLGVGTLTRVVLIHGNPEELVSLPQLARAFMIEAPEELFSALSQDYTSAMYTQAEGSRVVLVAKILENANETVLASIGKWRSAIEQGGITMFGTQVPTISPRFRDLSHQDTPFACIAISRQDLGVCYSIIDNLLVITTSGQGIEKVIEKITNATD
ncbi:MAG: hypothetical protein Q8P70_00125 [bacterium]|nr:hypothetical protein [bacterium]